MRILKNTTRSYMTIWWVIGGLFCVSPLAGQQPSVRAASDAALKISLELPHNRVRVGDAIALFIRLKNTSNVLRQVVQTDPVRDYDCRIKDDFGHVIPLSEYEQNIRKFFAGSARTVEIQPGAETNSVINIARLHSLAVGTYKISCSYLLAGMSTDPRGDSTSIVSNTTELVVYADTETMPYKRKSRMIVLQTDLPVAVVKEGSPVWLRLRIENTSSLTVSLDEWTPLAEYSFEVLRNGQPPALPLTGIARRRREAALLSVPDRLEVLPRQSNTNVLDISTLFDLSVPGTYQITASRSVLDSGDAEESTASSEPVLLTISRQ